jgi:hypothetical protein
LLLQRSVWARQRSLGQSVTSCTAKLVESEKKISQAMHHVIGAAQLLQMKAAAMASPAIINVRSALAGSRPPSLLNPEAPEKRL